MENIITTENEIQSNFDANWKSHELFIPSIPCSLKKDELACAIFINAVESLQKDTNVALKPVSISGDGNCLFSAVSVALVGNETLAYDLRILTAIELFRNPLCYANHDHFDKVSSQLKNSSANNLFIQSLSDIGCEKFAESKCKITALKEEAKFVAKNYNWSSFICVLALCNVVKYPIQLIYQPLGDSRMDALFTNTFQPKVHNNDQKGGKVILFWYRKGITKLHTGVVDRPNHFVTLLPLPSGKRKLKKCSLTFVPNENYVALPKPEQKKKKKHGSGTLITSYFGQCNQQGIEADKAVEDPVELPAQNKENENNLVVTQQVHVDNILEADKIDILNLNEIKNDAVPQFPIIENENIDNFDISNLVKNVSNMNNYDKLNYLDAVWKPDKNFSFPPSKSKRRFIYEWLTIYPWLCYSKRYDGAFCINCVLFHNNAQYVGQMEKLCRVPFKDWKNAKAAFEKHQHKSPYHKRSFEDTTNFRQTMTNKSTGINRQLDNIMHQQIRKNREILKSLIKILITMAQQCIPLRGRDESNPTAQYQNEQSSIEQRNLNPGNFLAIVKLAVELDCPILKEHLSKCAKNATYLSKNIQNELLMLISSNIIDQIVANIKQTKYFSILADEAVDISNKEQMPVVIRYVDSKGCIRETFVKMAECKLGCSGAALSETIVNAVEDINLDMNNCRGQGYDGAGAMAGKISGASTLIKNDFPKAIYVHCASHRLNLCVAASCTVPLVVDMMSQFQAVALFFYCSPVRTHVLRSTIESVSPEVEHSVVLNICRTRWIARLDGLDSFCDLLPSVLLTLEKITENEDRSFSRSNMDAARPLLLGITQFEFIAVLVIVQKILGYTRGLTVKLQSIDSDLARTSSDVLLLKRTLKVIRSDIDSHYDRWYERILSIANELDVKESIKRRCSIQLHRENYVANCPKEYYKRAVAIPFIDHLIQELDKRFNVDNLLVYSGFNIIPSVMFSDEGRTLIGDQPTWKVEFQRFVQKYKADIPAMPNLYAQLDLWKVKWKTYTGVLPTSLPELLKHTDKLIFPTIHETIKILATIPVTSCSCERSISGLRRVKTWMRNTMTEERLNSLCVIMFNREVPVDFERVVDQFAAANKRRMTFNDILSG